jgi:hypothetical protein
LQGDFNDTLNSSTTRKLGEGTDLHMVTSEAAIRDELVPSCNTQAYRSYRSYHGKMEALWKNISPVLQVWYEEKGLHQITGLLVASFKDVDND